MMKKLEELRKAIGPGYNNTLFERRLTEAIDEIYKEFISKPQKRKDIYKETFKKLKDMMKHLNKMYDGKEMSYETKELMRIDINNWIYDLWWWQEIIDSEAKNRVPIFKGNNELLEKYELDFLKNDSERKDYFEKLLKIVEKEDNNSNDLLYENILWIDDKIKHYEKRITEDKKKRDNKKAKQITTKEKDIKEEKPVTEKEKDKKEEKPATVKEKDIKEEKPVTVKEKDINEEKQVTVKERDKKEEKPVTVKERDKKEEKPVTAKRKSQKVLKLLKEKGVNMTTEEFDSFLNKGGKLKLTQVNGKKVYDYEAAHFIKLLQENELLKCKLSECDIMRNDSPVKSWIDLERNYNDYISGRKGRKSPRKNYKKLEEEIKKIMEE